MSNEEKQMRPTRSREATNLPTVRASSGRIGIFEELRSLAKNRLSEELVAAGEIYARAGDLERASYLLEILNQRKKKRYSNQLTKKIFELTGFIPISFLSLAHKITHEFQRSTKGNNHIYIALIDGFVKDGQPYGLYVGQTMRKVETRFGQHVSGGRTSARRSHRMRMLLPSLFEHLNPLSKPEALQTEKTLIERLNAAGVRTFGG